MTTRKKMVKEMSDSAVARFVTRGTDDIDGLFIGVKFKQGSNALKACRVYEIREFLNELVIVDMGPSAIKPVMPDYEGRGYRLGGCWGNSIDWLLNCVNKLLFLTEQEAISLEQTKSNLRQI